MPAPKSPHEMYQAMKANIKEKTGHSFDHWLKLAKAAKLDKFKALTDHMKAEHGLGHGYAQMLAWGVLDPARLEAGNKDQNMVDELYVGKKAHLRPIHEALLKAGMALGKDVDMVICKTYTSLRSKSQFAMIVPKTNSAIDLELAMPAGTSTTGSLETIKSSNPRFTHRIRIKDVGEIDAAVSAALTAAWRNNQG